MKLPYVKRSVLDEYKATLVKAEMVRHTAESAYQHCQKDLKTAEKIIEDVLPRLIRVDVRQDIEFNTYRICVDIHRGMVEEAFTHGGSQREIEYIASLLGKQVERKLIQFNFTRCERG